MVNPVFNWITRHLTIILLAVAIVMLGGTGTEQIDTLKTGVLAEMVALFLSHVALFTFTGENFNISENPYAKPVIFLGVHVLLGLVYAGSFFVTFSPK
ncbi:MAG: hypothetical protein JSS89_12195 [Bacteroidetes bacterium]|nr:hypothetical protein [Bacteroidota bacterium]